MTSRPVTACVKLPPKLVKVEGGNGRPKKYRIAFKLFFFYFFAAILLVNYPAGKLIVVTFLPFLSKLLQSFKLEV